jgi:hypothetical protein
MPAEFQPAQAQAPVARKSRRNAFLTRGSLVLLGIYATGFATLYLLGHSGGPKAAKGEQNVVCAKVDAALDLMDAQPNAGELNHQTNAKAIVDDFYTAAKQRQVDRNRLVRNPFVFKEKVPETAPVVMPKEVEPKDSVPAELKAAMEAVKTLRLQSVLIGKCPAALVSNNLVTTGQNIKGWTVSKIAPREVELTWKDQKYVLELPK